MATKNWKGNLNARHASAHFPTGKCFSTKGVVTAPCVKLVSRTHSKATLTTLICDCLLVWCRNALKKAVMNLWPTWLQCWRPNPSTLRYSNSVWYVTRRELTCDEEIVQCSDCCVSACTFLINFMFDVQTDICWYTGRVLCKD